MSNDLQNGNPIDKQNRSMPSYLIIIINIVILISNISFGLGYDFSDLTIGLIIFIHMIICAAFAVNYQRSSWWISMGIVALPLISLLLS